MKALREFKTLLDKVKDTLVFKTSTTGFPICTFSCMAAYGVLIREKSKPRNFTSARIQAVTPVPHEVMIGSSKEMPETGAHA